MSGKDFFFFICNSMKAQKKKKEKEMEKKKKKKENSQYLLEIFLNLFLQLSNDICEPGEGVPRVKINGTLSANRLLAAATVRIHLLGWVNGTRRASDLNLALQGFLDGNEGVHRGCLSFFVRLQASFAKVLGALHTKLCRFIFLTAFTGDFVGVKGFGRRRGSRSRAQDVGGEVVQGKSFKPSLGDFEWVSALRTLQRRPTYLLLLLFYSECTGFFLK